MEYIICVIRYSISNIVEEHIVARLCILLRKDKKPSLFLIVQFEVVSFQSRFVFLRATCLLHSICGDATAFSMNIKAKISKYCAVAN